jgi:hypothetical protein
MFFVPLVDGCSGLASLQLTNDSLYFSESAYATMEACSYGQGVFAHELGHNMGSRHDWYMDSGTTPDSIAHGYVDWINGFRTIMSYNNRCTAIGISCERIPRFSNPAVRHGGHVVGVAKGTSTSCEEGEKFPSLECDADSATLFNNKAATTAKFRDSRLTWNGGVDSNWANAANWNINEGAPGATVVNNRVPRSFDNLFIPGDPGLSFSPPIYNGSYNDPNITAGTLSARELVIADGAQLSMSGGTLNVGWRWQDLGGFKATGGTVEFSGPIGVTVDSSSAFQSIRVGSGTDSSVVSLANNLDVDDDLTISAGAILDAGNYTINLAGNWQEQGPTGFRASTSTVIFDGDGVAQSVNKASSSVVFTEDFSEGDNQDGFSTAYMPPGWSGENWFFGEHSGDGEALASGNAWLYSQSVTLDKNATYTLTLDFDQSYNSDDVLRVYYGKEVSPSDMTEVGSVSTTGTSNFEFKVPASGTYYVGFYHEKAGESGMSYMDNVGLSAYSGLNFYNLRVASGYVTVNEAITIENELRIDAGATLDTEDNVLTLNGTLINEGTLKGSVDQAGSCSKLEVTLNPSDYDTVSSEIMIKSEGIITLDYGASVTYRAPEIRLLPGFSALPGSSMVAKAEAVSCSGG